MDTIAQLFMWPDRALYLGPSFDPVVHQHHAVQICIGIDAPFQIALHEQAEWQSARAALIGSEVAHQISSQQTTMAFLYLEHERADYQAQLHIADNVVANAIKQDLPQSLLEDLLSGSQQCAVADAFDLCEQILALFGLSLNNQTAINSRIVKVLQQLDRTADGQCDSESLAAIACLSSSRLQHLFRQQLGVPIRRYSLWLRLRRVLAEAIEGKTLTEAAHGAGFSDSAHFSRVFKAMFGIAPSLLFSAGNAVKLHLLPMEQSET